MGQKSIASLIGLRYKRMFSRDIQGDTDIRLGNRAGYKPFVLGPISAALNLGAATVYPNDFVTTLNNFGTFTISRTGASGTFAASADYSCSDLGTSTVWIKGVHATYGTEIVATTVEISDGQGFCE